MCKSKYICITLIIFTLSVLPVRQAHALFALETTMQLMILPELSGIKGAIGGIVPGIAKINGAIGETIVSAMHKIAIHSGRADAVKKVYHEYGSESIIQKVCVNDKFADSLLISQMSSLNLSNDSTSWIESLVDTFHNRSQSNSATKLIVESLDVNRSTLLPKSNAFSEEAWGDISLFTMLMITPEPPITLTEKELNTTAGEQHETYKKLYLGKATYVNAALADSVADLTANISLDDWGDASSSVLDPHIIASMQANGHNMVSAVTNESLEGEDEASNWMLSKKSALQALSDARYGNSNWWKDVGMRKTSAWQQREQTAIAAMQLEASLRILNKMDHLVRLIALTTQENAVEPMRMRLDTLAKTAKSQAQRIK